MKTRLLHTLLILALLLPVEITAVSAQTTDCPITPGEYDGTMDATLSFSATNSADDLESNSTVEMVSSGELHFTISCEHVTGTVIRSTDFVGLGEISGGSVTENVFDTNGTCVQIGQIAAGNVVKNGNGPAELRVRLDVVEIQGECIGGGPDGSGLVGAAGGTTIFQISSEQGRQIAGNWRVEYDNGFTSESLLQSLADSGTIHIDSRTWSLTKQPKPSVTAVYPQYHQFFLHNVPLDNQYTAVINWDEGKPDKVTFDLAGQHQDGHISTDEETAIATFDMGTLPVSGPDGHPLQIVAYPQVGQPSDMVSGAVVIVPVPQWAEPLNFRADKAGNHVIYRGTLTLPEEQIETPVITLPADVPYIGGKWGLSPTQLKITVPANSLGGEYSDPGPEFRTTGQLFLGTNNTLGLRASGDITTTLTPSELTLGGNRFQLALAQATLLDQQVAVSKFLPGADAIIAANIPVVSSLLQSMNNVAYLKGNITADLTGGGEISSNDTEIYLAQASLRSTVNVMAEADLGVDFFVKGHIGVGAKGTLGVQIVPGPPKITECGMGLTFMSRFVVLGQALVDDVNEPVALTIPGCSDPVITNKPSGNFRLGATTPLSGGTTVGLLPEQTVFSTTVVNNLPESTLVQNGSWLAAPALAVSPNGTQALAWNSGAPGEIPDQVQVRWTTSGGWSEPLTLSKQPAFSPVTAFDGRFQLLTLWTEAHTPAESLTSAYVQGMEIGWALVDVNNGRISQQGTLTHNTLLDFSPKLVTAADGSVWAIWQHSPGSQLVGTVDSPNVLHAARWDGEGWSDVETVTDQLVGTLTWQAAAGNNLWLVADGDMDGNLTTAVDRELFAYTRTNNGWTTTQLTHNELLDTAPLLAATPQGQPALAWLQGDAVVGLSGDLAAQPTVWLGPEAQVSTILSNGRLLAGENGEMQLLWPEVSAQGQDILQSQRDPATGTWSSPAPLFNTTEKRASLAVAVAPDGDVLLAMTRTAVTTAPAMLDNDQTVEFATTGEQADVVLTTLSGAFSPSTNQPPTPSGLAAVNGRFPWMWLGGLGLLLAVGLIVWLRRRSL